jgi:hypothetical protein
MVDHTMDLLSIFATILLGSLGLVLVTRTLWICFIRTQRTLFATVYRHFVYPRLFPGQHIFNPSRSEVFFHLVHWAGTVFCNVYGIHSISDAGQRAGNLALVHLAPLLATTQLSFASDLMGLSLTVTRSIHRAFGLMAAVQSAFHTTVALTADRQPQPQLIPVVTVSTTVFRNNL